MQIRAIGKHNSRLREVRSALRTGALTGDGLLPVEGPHLVEEAIRSGLEVSEVFVRKGEAPPPGFDRVYEVGASTFAHLSSTREPQGIIALVRLPAYTLEHVIERAGIIVILCGLQDPGNVGTILRLADAFGCAGCIAVDPTAHFHNDKAVRASAGSLFRIPHVRMSDLDEVRRSMVRASVAVVGTAPEAPVSITLQNWSRPTAILLGNEGQGLSTAEREMCDTMIRIPCPGSVESLNTANAAAIVLYEATRGKIG